MKLETKILVIILISFQISLIATSKYDSFISGLAKSFGQANEEELKSCFENDWKSDSNTDTNKALETLKEILPKMTNIRNQQREEMLICNVKNKIKEYWMNVVSKSNKKADAAKAKENAQSSAPAKKSFLQVSVDSKRVEKKVKKTKWGVFSLVEKDIVVNRKNWNDFASSGLIKNLVKVVGCAAQKGDFKVKTAAEEFKNGTNYIKANLQGFVDFFVNFICDKNTFADGHEALKKGVAGTDQWKNIGVFVGKVLESMHNNNLTAR